MTVYATQTWRDSADLNRVPQILMYHSVAPYHEDPYEVTMTPQRFARQMRWLRSRGLRGVAMSELLDAHAAGQARRLVGLTFDDGYRDLLTYALPVLTEFGFSATAFVLAGRFGGYNEWSSPGPRKELLTAAEVRAVADAGIEIGSHGMRHISLPAAGADLLAAEIVHSRAILQDLLGRPVPGFCYPYGDLDTRVVDAVRDAGYDYACAVGRTKLMGRHAVPRTYVHDRDTWWRLDAKRLVSKVTVGNSLAVRLQRGGE